MGFPGPRSWTCGCFEPEVRLGKKRVVTGQTTSLQDQRPLGTLARERALGHSHRRPLRPLKGHEELFYFL